MQKIILKLAKEDFKVLDDARFECFVLPENLSADFKKEFTKRIAQKNKLTLGTSVADCLDFNFNGVILDLSKSEHIARDYQDLTKNLKRKIVGVVTRNRRHEAMLVSECEPDFVIFKAWKDGQEKIKELTSWYNEMFLIQSALLPQEEMDYESFETDFLILDDVFAL